MYSVPQSRMQAWEQVIQGELQPLGKATLSEKTMIVFPNSHVHKVTPLRHNGDLRAAYLS